MNLRCVNCGGEDVVVGDAGLRSACARCGCETFKRKMGNGTVTETRTPGKTTLKVEPFRGVPPAKARRMFDEIHAAIDSAAEAFDR